jgi:hypothetical protein
MSKNLPVLTLCARECTACPEFAAQEDGTVALYDNARPGERVVFSRADIRQIRDAAVQGRLEQFC